MRIQRYKKKHYWGGASAYQKGVAAELRTFVTTTTHNMLNGIVHSGDRAVQSSFLADPTNSYDPVADDIIVAALIESSPTYPADKIATYLQHNDVIANIVPNPRTSKTPTLKGLDAWPDDATLRAKFEAEPAHKARVAKTKKTDQNDPRFWTRIRGDANMFDERPVDGGIAAAEALKTLGPRVLTKRVLLGESVVKPFDKRSTFGKNGARDATAAVLSGNLRSMTAAEAPTLASLKLKASTRVNSLPERGFPIAGAVEVNGTKLFSDAADRFGNAIKVLKPGWSFLETDQDLLFPDDPLRMALATPEGDIKVWELTPADGVVKEVVYTPPLPTPPKSTATPAPTPPKSTAPPPKPKSTAPPPKPQSKQKR